MQNPENVVWQSFRRANQGAFRELHFNVSVGSVPGLTDNLPPAEIATRTALWAKRVDVVAETTDDVWLIEVKAHARASSVGQTLTYIPLLATRRPTWSMPRPILIAATFDPDAATLCDTLGLECYTLPFAPLPSRFAR